MAKTLIRKKTRNRRGKKTRNRNNKKTRSSRRGKKTRSSRRGGTRKQRGGVNFDVDCTKNLDSSLTCKVVDKEDKAATRIQAALRGKAVKAVPAAPDAGAVSGTGTGTGAKPVTGLAGLAAAAASRLTKLKPAAINPTT